MQRRKFTSYIAAALLGAVCTVSSSLAVAQTYPTKAIKILVGFAPGGLADGSARLISDVLSRSLKQPVVVENRPGAGGTIAATEVAKSAPDGYTLLMASSGHAGNGAYYANLHYDTLKSFTAVGSVASSPVIIVVAETSPYKTLEDLVDDARRHPDKLNIATGGGATLTNLAAEMLKSDAKIKFQSVPYKGSAPLLSALIGGDVSAAVDVVSSSQGLVRGGKLRALAVTSATRSSVMPTVPTLNEAIKTAPFDVTGWYGLLAPAGTPQALVTRLNREINQALSSPEVVAKLANMGADPMKGDPEQFNKLLVSETARWTRLIRQLGLKAE